MQNLGSMMHKANIRMQSRWHLPFLVSCTLLVCMLQLALAAQMPRYGCIWLHLLELWTSNCLCRQVGCLIHGCSLSAEADRQCLCVNLFDRGSPILHTSRFITEYSNINSKSFPRKYLPAHCFKMVCICLVTEKETDYFYILLWVRVGEWSCIKRGFVLLPSSA